MKNKVAHVAYLSSSVLGTPVAAGRSGFWSFPRLLILLFPLTTVTFILDRLRIHPDMAISLYRPLHIAILFAMAISLLMRGGRVRTCTLTPTVLFLLMFNAALIISLVFAHDLSASVPAALTLIQLSLAGLVVGVFLINFWDVRYMSLLATMMCWVAVVSGLTLITDYIGLTSFKSVYLDREIVRQIGILGEPNFAAGKLAIGFPFVIWAFLEAALARRTFSAMGYATGCGLIIIAIFVTGSRMGILMVAMSLAVVAIKEWKRLLRPRSFLISSLLATTVFLLLRDPFGTMFDSVMHRTEPLLAFIKTRQDLREPSAAMRAEMLSAGWDIFRDHPVFGVGIDGYREILPLYSPFLGNRYAHNTFVEILTGTGLLGFMPFTALVISIVKRMWRGWQSKEKSRLPFYFALSSIMMTTHLFFLSDYPNRYLWGLFLPLSIYLEWFNARRSGKERAHAGVNNTNHVE